MANYITNLVTIYGTPREINEVLNFMKDEDQPDEDPYVTIDFEKIEPIPDYMFFASVMEQIHNGNDDDPQIIEWKIDNWGTQQYTGTGQFVDENTICFATLNGAAVPIVEKLSLIYKKLVFQICWADTINRYIQGVLRYKDGTAQFKYIPTIGSRESEELNDWVDGKEINNINNFVERLMKK